MPTLPCPGCHKPLTIPDAPGKAFRCPACKTVVRVPDPAEALPVLPLAPEQRPAPWAWENRRLVIGLTCAAFVLFCLIPAGILGGYLVNRWMAPAVQKAQQDRQERDAKEKKRLHGPLSRDQVRDAAKGKTPREVIEVFGKPEMTFNTPDSLDDPKYSGHWTYHNLSVDPASGEYETVWVHFQDGRVNNFRFGY
jgi:hypothetical protein